MRALLGAARQRCRLYRPSCFYTLPANFPTEGLVKVQINGREVQVPNTSTVMQACLVAGVDVPRFCYHERLGVAGNCRMCLVQVNEGAKLVASCAAPVMPDMRIQTDAPPVKKAREGVMEFLLANHPLDCPICDQGGECDLQDQAMAFGSDRSRFQIKQQSKRAVEDKDFGPLIETSMNRCIHCTRCVRFANEVAGVQELGTSGRGNDMQIGTYIHKTINSELSGNIIDLCPVGALTSKPYAFTARPWELRRTDSIDVMDAVGASIKIDSRGMEVMRILPRLNEEVNEEWISDKTRFSYDGLRQQRLVQPLWKQPGPDSAVLVPVSWGEALGLVSEKLSQTPPEGITGVIGSFADLESTFALLKLLEGCGAAPPVFDGSNLPEDAIVPAELLREMRFNTSLEGIEHADAILFVGTNPKVEAPLLSARIRKAWLRNDIALGFIGTPTELTFTVEHLGQDFSAFDDLISGKGAFAKAFKGAQRPAIIVGQSAVFSHPDARQTLERVLALGKKHQKALFQPGQWSGLNFLPHTASRTGALMLGCAPFKAQHKSKFLYLLNSDDFDRAAVAQDTFVVYQGHHGDSGAALADVILPSPAYTEKDASFVNMEGRIQRTRAAVPPPGEAREDWAVIRALSEFADICLPFNNIDALRSMLAKEYPELSTLDAVPEPRIGSIFSSLALSKLQTGAKPSSAYYSPISDFYLTDCISRNSPTMAKCSLAFTSKAVAASEGLEAQMERHADRG